MKAKQPHSTTGLLFVAPTLVCIAGVLIYPMLNSIALSFTNKMFTYEKYRFIGLDNYFRLFQDKLFWVSLGHSIQYTFFGVAGVLIVGLLLALLLHSDARYIGFFRGLLFLPWTMPSIVVALTFGWLYNDFYGYLNHLLIRLHVIDTPYHILSDSNTAWMGVLIPLIWCFYPFAMVFLLAALQTIDKSLYQAAQIDGANRMQMFWHITLPSLVSSLVVVSILEAIWIFCSFDLVFLLTNGGPNNATMTLSLYIYRMAFGAKEMAYGMALSVLMFVVLVVFTLLYFFAVGRSRSHESP